jgi:hypothetical protein
MPREIDGSRIDAGLADALAGKGTLVFFDALRRAGGMPGPRPNVDLLRAVGARLAAGGKAGQALVRTMLADEHPALHRAALHAVSAEKDAIARLHDLADEPVKLRRDSVVDALAEVMSADADAGAAELARFTDGFLHAHVALDALGDPRVLDRLSGPTELFARFAEAFDLADGAPRSADRSQGLRILREGMPAQLARVVPRFREALGFIEERTDRERPETRQVVAQMITALRNVVARSRLDDLRARLEATEKPPRDPTRIVKGTRKRSRGR